MSISEILKAADLKITPQRVVVIEAIAAIDGHPTSDQILEYVRKTQPNIGTGTVYQVIKTFVEKGILRKVKTDKDVMRYDSNLKNHHHLYCIQCDYIEDYESQDIDKILKKYFDKNPIPNFTIEDIKLQISGNFVVHKSQQHPINGIVNAVDIE